VFNASTRNDGFPSFQPLPSADPFRHKTTTYCFIDVFYHVAFVNPHGTSIAGIQANPVSKECVMKLQFGKNQLVLELSASPFAWFHGQTERMSLTSLSLLFVQFSLFARHPAV